MHRLADQSARRLCRPVSRASEGVGAAALHPRKAGHVRRRSSLHAAGSSRTRTVGIKEVERLADLLLLLLGELGLATLALGAGWRRCTGRHGCCGSRARRGRGKTLFRQGI